MKRNKAPLNDYERELAPLRSASLDETDVPNRVRIAPWGTVTSTRGNFIVDDESADAMIEAFQKAGHDLPIDYEHQTLGGPYASPNGQAPAAGWIKQIEAVPGDGIYAHVEWTPPAIEQLTAKQYRYLSLVALVRKSDRKMVGLHSVALTNKPAIVGMEPLVHRDIPTHQADALTALRQQLHLDDDCDVEHVLLTASRRIDLLDTEREIQQAERRVQDAIRSGRATEAQRGFALRLALSDADLFEQWLRTAPVVVPMGRTTGPESTGPALTEHNITSMARAEYRAHRELNSLTTEEAYVGDAVRRHRARLNG